MNLEGWKWKARKLKRETLALYLAYRDPRVPWYARVLAALVVGYVFSPIDPIPDFIPVVDLLDELVVVSIGVALLLNMVPPEVMAECREEAAKMDGKPVNRTAAFVVVGVWLLAAALALVVAARLFRGARPAVPRPRIPDRYSASA